MPADPVVALLPVTQADRDAVQAFHRTMLDRLMSDVKSQRPKLGDDEGDAGTLVQAFARHRLAHRTPAPAGDVRIVPVEPTQAMREAGEDILAQNGCLVLPEEMADVWSAMLTASSTTDSGGADGKDGPAFEVLERFLTDHEGNDETAEGQDVDRLARRAITNLRGVVSAALAVGHSATDDCRSGRIVTIDPDAFDSLNTALDRVGDSSAISGSAEGLREAMRTANGIASGPDGSGRMKVSVYGLEPGEEQKLHFLLSSALTEGQQS